MPAPHLLITFLQTAPSGGSSGGIGTAFDALGINLPTLIAFVVNFGLLLLILWATLYKPVLKVLDERRRRIEEGLTAADRAAESARESDVRVQEQIRQAQLQGQEIVANAQQIALRVQEEARRDAETQAAEIARKSQRESQQQLDNARAALRREFADLTILAAERVINRSLDQRAQIDLINEVLAEAGA